MFMILPRYAEFCIMGIVPIVTVNCFFAGKKRSGFHLLLKRWHINRQCTDTE